ncbi:MAG: MazG nucleotide pyrophosphohydrolase domain-containing protein [Patescibacteria group bacterium]|nr:MazG nucleotide pyrophosphohydrolase domain-containing protein [Patescibacteria group bacterium]
MQNLSIKQFTEMILKLAEEKGFGTEPKDINTMEKIALIHGEVSEAMEAYRHKKMDGKDGLAEELADIVIRVFHLAGIYKIDLEKEILSKLENDKNRKWKWEDYNETHS